MVPADVLVRVREKVSFGSSRLSEQIETGTATPVAGGTEMFELVASKSTPTAPQVPPIAVPSRV
jgi:hypothetical protein